MAKYQSRWARLDGALTDFGDALESAKTEYNEAISKDESEKAADEALEAYSDQVNELKCDAVGTVEELRDEIGSWKDNIEEKFSATQKYADLEECYDALDGLLNDLEEIGSDPESDEVPDGSDVNFPGMY